MTDRAQWPQGLLLSVQWCVTEESVDGEERMNMDSTDLTSLGVPISSTT